MKLNLTLVIVIATLSIPIVGISLDSVYSDADLPTEISVQGGLMDYELEKDLEKDKQNTKENTTKHLPKFFAIQHAQSGSISEINETTYSLELNGVSDKTILFSDRPDRIVKSISTVDFIGNWFTGSDSFTVDAPNAVLVVDEQEEQQDVAIVELFNPIYDSEKKSLKYEITPDNATSIVLPNEFGQTTIVIDPDTVAPIITD